MKKEIDINEIHKFELGILKEIKRICEDNSITYYLLAGTILGAVRHKGFIPWDEDGDIIIPINQYKKFRESFEKQLSNKYKLLTCDDPSFPEYFMRVVLNGQDPMCAYIDVYFLIGAPSTELERIKMLKKQSNIMKAKYMRYLKVSDGKSFLKRIARFLGKTWYRLLPLKHMNNKYFIFANKYDLEKSDYVHCSYGRYGMKNFFNKEVFSGVVYMEFEGVLLPVPIGYKEILTQFYGDYNQYPSESVISAGLKHTAIYIEEESKND